MGKISVYKVLVPDYQVDSRPDFGRIGFKIDELLRRRYLDQKLVIRCLGSQEHPGKSADDVIHIIKKLGTDRYDPARRGDRYENVENKSIDIFGLDFKITKNKKYSEYLLEPFYSWPIKNGEKPVRIDIIILYDRAKLKKVYHRYKGRRGVKKDGFIFKDKDNKVGSLKGVIKIL